MKMKINQIVIENFRCFKGIHKLDLQGKTTILYGDNGYGKSSFFDALEWGITGNVDRFRKPGEKYIDKKIISNRLTKSGERCSVEVGIGEIFIRRFFKIIDNPRETILIRDSSNNVIVQGKEEVEKYILDNIAMKTANKKLLFSLLKKSHLLSQDQITDFVLRDKPKERFDSLADIMGYRQQMNLVKNLKRVKDDLNRIVRRQEHDVSTYTTILEKKSKEKYEVDQFDLSSLLNELNLDLDHPDLLKEIKLIEEKFLSRKGKIHEKVSKIQEFGGEIEASNTLELEENARKLKSKIQKSNEKINRTEKLIYRISEENKMITKKKSDVESNENIINELESINKEINKINNSVAEIGVKEEEIKPKLDKEELLQQELFFAKTHLHEYQDSKITSKNCFSYSNENRAVLEKVNMKLRLSRKKYDSFRELNIEEDSSTSLNKLNMAIQDIYAYVNDNNSEGICPVCSTYKGDDLYASIYNNIQKNLASISTNSNRLTKISRITNKFENKIESLEANKRNLEKEIKNLTSKYKFHEMKLEDLKRNEFFREELFMKSYEQIEEMLTLSSKKISNLNKQKGNYFTLDSLNKKFNQLEKRDNQNEDNESIKIIDRIATLERRKEIILNIQAIERENIKIIERDMEVLNKKLYLLSSTISKKQKGLTFKEIFAELVNEVKAIDIELNKIKKAYKSYQKVRENTKIENEVVQYKEIIEINKKKNSVYKRELQNIEDYRNSVFIQVGDIASDLLNKPNSNIQKYFRYLNPVPNVNKVLFNSTSPEELEILLSYEDKESSLITESNVQYSLSSGQLYVLAISIFLAINEDQNVSKFDFVGIDDPIQNMDDVNQFSICDVLSSINRQLIFSTHDFDFLKLFLKKNEYKKDSIQVFMLENNDDSVTEVKRIEL